MQQRELYWDDGKVLEEKLGLVVGKLQQLVKKSRVASKGYEELKAARDLAADMHSTSPMKVQRLVDKKMAEFEWYSQRIPARQKELWNKILAKVEELLYAFALTYDLGPQVKTLILRLDDLREVSKVLDVVADSLRKAYSEVWHRWNNVTIKTMQVPDAKALNPLNIQLCMRKLERFPPKVYKALEFAEKSGSSLVLRMTTLYISELAKMPTRSFVTPVVDLAENFFEELQWFYSINQEINDISSTKLNDELGSGAFGVVHSAHYKGQEVVQKRLENTSGPLALHRFILELSAWEHVSNKNPSPYILKLIGAGLNTNLQSFAFLSEKASLGNLQSMLDNVSKYDLRFVRSIALDIARGMLHMHSLEYVHLDIKPENVLLFRDKSSETGIRAKLGDFGLARKECLKEYLMGTPLYMPIEACIGGRYSYANDIYAFGVVLYQLVEPQRFRELYEERRAAAFVEPLGAGRFRPQTSSAVRSLIRKCLGPYTLRPAAKYLVKKLPQLRFRLPLSYPSRIVAVSRLLRSSLTAHSSSKETVFAVGQTTNETRSLLPTAVLASLDDWAFGLKNTLPTELPVKKHVSDSGSAQVEFDEREQGMALKADDENENEWIEMDNLDADESEVVAQSEKGHGESVMSVGLDEEDATADGEIAEGRFQQVYRWCTSLLNQIYETCTASVGVNRRPPSSVAPQVAPPV